MTVFSICPGMGFKELCCVNDAWVAHQAPMSKTPGSSCSRVRGSFGRCRLQSRTEVARASPVHVLLVHAQAGASQGIDSRTWSRKGVPSKSTRLCIGWTEFCTWKPGLKPLVVSICGGFIILFQGFLGGAGCSIHSMLVGGRSAIC